MTQVWFLVIERRIVIGQMSYTWFVRDRKIAKIKLLSSWNLKLIRNVEWSSIIFIKQRERWHIIIKEKLLVVLAVILQYVCARGEKKHCSVQLNVPVRAAILSNPCFIQASDGARGDLFLMWQTWDRKTTEREETIYEHLLKVDYVPKRFWNLCLANGKFANFEKGGTSSKYNSIFKERNTRYTRKEEYSSLG